MIKELSNFWLHVSRIRQTEATSQFPPGGTSESGKPFALEVPRMEKELEELRKQFPEE